MAAQNVNVGPSSFLTLKMMMMTMVVAYSNRLWISRWRSPAFSRSHQRDLHQQYNDLRVSGQGHMSSGHCGTGQHCVDVWAACRVVNTWQLPLSRLTIIASSTFRSSTWSSLGVKFYYFCLAQDLLSSKFPAAFWAGHRHYTVNHKKVEPFYICNNFVKYQHTWIIFGTRVA